MKLKLHHMHHFQFAAGPPNKKNNYWNEWQYEKKYIIHGHDDDNKSIIVIYNIRQLEMSYPSPLSMIDCGWQPLHRSCIKLIFKTKP